VVTGAVGALMSCARECRVESSCGYDALCAEDKPCDQLAATFQMTGRSTGYMPTKSQLQSAFAGKDENAPASAVPPSRPVILLTDHKMRRDSTIDPTVAQCHPHVPFDGFKHSGISPELGEYAL